LYDVDEVRRWLTVTGEPTATHDGHVPSEYRRFYGLEFEGAAHEMGYLDAAGEHIFVQHFAPHSGRHPQPVGTMFLLHGYLDHSGLHHRTIGRLLGRGMHVVAFDEPGHGLSTGHRASIESFANYVECVDVCKEFYADLPGPHCIMGHSMGGAVSMTCLLTRPGDFSKAVLVAPLFRPRSWRLIRSLHAVGRHFIERQPRRFVQNTGDESFRHFIREVDPLSPREVPMQWVTSMFDWTREFVALDPSDAQVLVVQGTDDGTVDWHGNLEVIRKKFNNVRIHLVNEGKHHLLNETEDISEIAWQAIEPFLRGHY